MSEQTEPIGKVTDYFWKRETVRIEVLRGSIAEGDELRVKGEFTDETITAEDLSVDEQPVEEARSGEVLSMPLPMSQRVVLGDDVFPAESSSPES